MEPFGWLTAHVGERVRVRVVDDTVVISANESGQGPLPPDMRGTAGYLTGVDVSSEDAVVRFALDPKVRRMGG